ncbi:WD40 repeat domain-containing protein [Streptomyces neyagawaensis]|uniref:WD40 repeat domain-containing protein n=1 Tax=Streptomyces neyagawaensis TaxID=42238 RepID=UPI00201CDA86|nr:hypothetical protein [Streptomyces neyagawaensis]MCL6732478.1 hypothetical protein [Streptomyces neyagawaensis]MDE1687116.1 hypothetical protein [Streptomyces neyagawaensis]
MLTAITAALCLAVVATGLAVGQWRSAVTAQRLAESRQLAAESAALLDTDPDLAALLAVRAYRMSPTREAIAALFAAAALPLRKRLVGGTEPVEAVALAADGRAVAAHSADGTVRLWELPSGRIRHTLTGIGIGIGIGIGSGNVMAFSPDGHALAIASATEAGVVIGLWDTAAGLRLRASTVRDGAVRAMAFSPDGRAVVASSPSAVRVWDAATGRTRHTFTGDFVPQAVAFGPGGRTVVSVSRVGRVRVWDAATGRTGIAHDSRVEADAVAVAPDGRAYAVIRADGVVQLRDVTTGNVLRTFRGSPVGADAVSFSPDGRTLAVSGPGGTVRMWDPASGAVLGTVSAGHRGRGTVKAALGVDGHTLVTGSGADPVVRIHHVTLNRPRTALRADAGTYVADLAFSPDGHSVGAVQHGPPGRRYVRLWDTATSRRGGALLLDAAPDADTDTGGAPPGQQPPLTCPAPGCRRVRPDRTRPGRPCP